MADGVRIQIGERAVTRAVRLRTGRLVDEWWVTDISDTAERMSAEVGCSMADAYRCIAAVARDRALSAEAGDTDG